MKNYFFKLFLLASILIPFSIQAKIKLPENNTNTCISSQNSGSDFYIASAYIYNHMFGHQIYFELFVQNKAAQKEIWIYEKVTQENNRAFYVSRPQEMTSNGAKAVWIETNRDNYDRIFVKVDSLGVLAYLGKSLNPHNFNIYVKVGNEELSVENIQLDFCSF